MKENHANNGKFSSAQTSRDEMLEQSRLSGLTYNEAKEYIARTTGGHGTNIYSDTDVEEVRRKNQQSQNNK
ncbi:hypothetical protein FH966_01165 [Lentibacillus cibarius]|uniref:Small, acid-soluble spore protein gamma-type n=1 Tax=Lentibacillus cibarius TaxID=2583219 RepID=A0A549YEX2_9BACI|nr:hypothetical protein [Lentibacillus cibarius]TMN21539.1 hypothetical protein FFL34_05010 [Lentibacillus cibarius]TRM10439.1 hypothetical protein FH966_01165 [Lentibacillus cibarius]